MRSHLVLAAALVATPLMAQQSGISHPPDAIVQDVPSQPAAPAKPSAAIPAENTASDSIYQPYRRTIALHTRTEPPAPADPDSGIVTDVPRRPNELPAGTVLRMRLRSEITTDQTQPNTPFIAELSENVIDNGRVVLPAGSTVEGVISEVRGGKRIWGAALIHLETRFIVLPDGTRTPLRAAVIDTDQYAHTRVDEEGNIRRKDHVGATLAAMSLTTGGAAAAGGVLGGPAGALVGAGVGAGVSTVWWLKQDRQAHLPGSTLLVFGLTEPLTIRGLVREPNFSSAPTALPDAGPSTQAYRQTQPAYTAAPQSFVPTN